MTNLAETFSCLAASRHAVRAYKPDPVPSSILDAILADATSAPSWSNTRPFALALATGEQADRIRAAYVEEFDRTLDAQHGKPLAIPKLVLSGHAPDGDYKVWKPYPKELRPHQAEVARLLYGAQGVERHDHEGRDQSAHGRSLWRPRHRFRFRPQGIDALFGDGPWLHAADPLAVG